MNYFLGQIKWDYLRSQSRVAATVQTERVKKGKKKCWKFDLKKKTNKNHILSSTISVVKYENSNGI